LATKAYILIETSVGKSKDVVTQLRSCPEVRTADAVTGQYDVVAIVEAEDLNAVGDVLTSHIHPLKGIVRTVTCLSSDGGRAP
jgi:DNA-binding Lrp family transcriptional regulator